NDGGSVPGGNNYTGATSGARERGVAGSGLPREKVSVVDTKTLPSSKIDGKFSSSLMEAGLQSHQGVKSTASATAGKTDGKSNSSLMDSGLKPAGATTEKGTAKSQTT